MKKSISYALILTSGGIDSTACINFYKKMGFDVDALFIDFGQPSRIKEYKAATLIANYYDINLNRVLVKSRQQIHDGFIPGRNAFLLFSALMNFTKDNGIIGIGIHNGTNYFDCSKDFVVQVQNIFDQYSQGTVKIGVPFLNFNKKEIWDYCNLEQVPIHLSYSCELGKKQPCGYCTTCKDLEAIYASKK